MTRAPLTIASMVVASGLLVASMVPTDQPSPIDPRLGVLSNSSHDMPSARQRLADHGVDVSTTGLLSLADDRGADSATRYLAVLALSEVTSTDVEPILMRALDDDNADLRYAAVVAFRDRGSRHAERALLRALDDPAEGVRSITIASLATVGGPLAARSLAGRLAAGLLDGYQAVDAAVTLGELGQPIAGPALRQVLDDSLAADCPPELKASACLNLHLVAATQRDEMPIATDCSADRASAADLRAAAGAALRRLGQPATEAMLLGALHPCTSSWLRTDVIDGLSALDDRPFTPTKSLAGPAGEPTADTLNDIATWWRQR